MGKTSRNLHRYSFQKVLLCSRDKQVYRVVQGVMFGGGLGEIFLSKSKLCEPQKDPGAVYRLLNFTEKRHLLLQKNLKNFLLCCKIFPIRVCCQSFIPNSVRDPNSSSIHTHQGSYK